MKGPKAKVRKVDDSPDTTSTSDTGPPPPPFHTNNVTHSGWLSRKQNQKSRFKKNWQKCWFVIADGQLHYFKHQGSLPLQGCKMMMRNYKDTDNEPQGFVLEVHPGEETVKATQSHKPFLVSAPTQSEIDIWEREIRRVRGGVFGTSLEETIVNESENETKEIPAVVEKCVSYIREHGLMEEGIFRLNGRTGIVQQLQDSIDTGEFPDLQELEVGVHTVASLLKRYFQLLPEPIIPWRHCKHFIPVMQELREREEYGRRQLILQLALLPKVNYNLLKYLCEFLHEVHLYEEQNKMSLGNLANIFAPHILRPQNAQGAYLLGSTALSLQLVHYLIRNQSKVFPPLDSINTSPPPMRTGFRYDTPSPRIYRKGTTEYNKLNKVERRSEESRARSKSRTNRRSGRVDWTTSTEIIDGECIDTVKVEVHSVYENMDISNGMSLIDAIKSRISDSSSRPNGTNGTNGTGGNGKRIGVSYKDPSSISSDLGQRCYPTGKGDAMSRENNVEAPNRDIMSQIKIQSSYQNIELGPGVLQSIASSMKDHAMTVRNSQSDADDLHHNDECPEYSPKNGKTSSADMNTHKNNKNLMEHQYGGDDLSTSRYQNQDLHLRKKTGSFCALNFPNDTRNLYQNPLPFPMTLPDEILQELKNGTRPNNSNLIPKPTNKEYASSDIINGHSNTLPPGLTSTNGINPATINGKVSLNSKVSYSGEVVGHMQALRSKLRQKEEEMGKHYRHVELIKKDYELLKIRLCAEESTRIMIEEHNRQLTSEVHLLQKRLGLVS